LPQPDLLKYLNRLGTPKSLAPPAPRKATAKSAFAAIGIRLRSLPVKNHSFNRAR
jgi:hypothetical protein